MNNFVVYNISKKNNINIMGQYCNRFFTNIFEFLHITLAGDVAIDLNSSYSEYAKKVIQDNNIIRKIIYRHWELSLD